MINAPITLTKELVRSKQSRILHQYMVCSYLMAGQGWMSRQSLLREIQDFCDVSYSTAFRWVRYLSDRGYLSRYGSNYIIKGKPRVGRKIQVPAEVLSKYDSFKSHIVTQLALFKQAQLRYMYKAPLSTKTSDSIEKHTLPLTKQSVGCAFSLLESEIGISKAESSTRLKGNIRLTYNFLWKCNMDKISEIRILRSLDPRYFYGIRNGVLLLYYRLGSVVTAPSFIK